jgi:Dolichyl-phosphate-mannose-protein mannosyltransferase
MSREHSSGHQLALRDDHGPFNSIPFFLLLLCILVRFPFYFASVIDWDESTFILMGQNLLDGNLPYVELWDNKPPLAFAFFAPVILFWKSIVAVRIAGTICVFTTAYFTYRIGTRIWQREVGLLAAIFSVVFISLLPAGQATMTEIIALVPTMGALLILHRGTSNLTILFFAGCLLSIATLVRTNLGYVAVAVGLVSVCLEISNGFGPFLKRAGAYGLGGLLPLTLVFLPYVITQNENLFFNSVFLAPLYYVKSHYSSATEATFVLIRAWDFSNVILWIGFLGGVVLFATHWKHYDAAQRYQTILISTFFLSMVWSIMSTGSDFPHYRIQLIPFMSLFAGYFFSFLQSNVSRGPSLILLIIGLVVPAKPVLDQYASLVAKLAAHQPLESDRGYRIASYIKSHNPSGESIYMMTDHVVYWLLGLNPIAKSVTHPSTIGREYLLKLFLGQHASTEGELATILAKRPLFLVKPENVWYLPSDAIKMLEDSISANYVLVSTIDGVCIYEEDRGRKVH